MIIKVCVGSSCHLKGSYFIIQQLQELLKQNHLANKVTIKAEFCMGNCTQGIPVEIDGRRIQRVQVDNVNEIFKQYVKGAFEETV